MDFIDQNTKLDDVTRVELHEQEAVGFEDSMERRSSV